MVHLGGSSVSGKSACVCLLRVDATLLHWEEKPSILFFFFKAKGDAGIKESHIISHRLDNASSPLCCETDQVLQLHLQYTTAIAILNYACVILYGVALFAYAKGEEDHLASSWTTIAGLCSPAKLYSPVAWFSFLHSLPDALTSF